MTGSWSNYAVNLFAPGLADFTEASIPDLTAEFPEAPHWIQNYLLNSLLSGSYAERYKQAALGFLRRSHHAFRHYHEARRLTLDYTEELTPGRPPVGLYYDAVHEWENYLLQMQMAFDLYGYFFGKLVFDQKDESPEQRLYDLGNAVKHFKGHLQSKDFKPSNIVPLWLDNSGLVGVKLSATYEEAAKVMRDCASVADDIQNPVGLKEAIERANQTHTSEEEETNAEG